MDVERQGSAPSLPGKREAAGPTAAAPPGSAPHAASAVARRAGSVGAIPPARPR